LIIDLSSVVDSNFSKIVGLLTEDGLLLITRLNINIVEYITYVKLSEVLDILEFHDKLKDQWK